MTPDFVSESLAGRVVFGSGSRKLLGAELERLGSTKAVVIAAKEESSIAEPLIDELGQRVVGVFDEVMQHVPEECAARCIDLVRSSGADAVVTVGGGSATGFGKAVRLESEVKSVAIPTTYAGSEMTSIWGKSSNGEKRTGVNPRVKPDTVIYDPELTVSLPAHIAGPSGMNALAHCVEALYGPGANPLTSIIALEGIRALASGLPRVCGTDDTIEARTDVLYGAYLAGIALAVGGTALHHKACHVLGGMFNLDHGKMNAILLPHAVSYNAPAIASVMQDIARVLMCDANDVPTRLWDLSLDIGAPHGLGAMTMPVGGIAPAAVAIVAAASNNIRTPDVTSITSMIEDAYFGRPPSPARLPAEVQ